MTRALVPIPSGRDDRELRRLRAAVARRRALLAASGELVSDARLGDTAGVPEIVQPDGLPTRAPTRPFTDDPFFRSR